MSIKERGSFEKKMHLRLNVKVDTMQVQGRVKLGIMAAATCIGSRLQLPRKIGLQKGYCHLHRKQTPATKENRTAERLLPLASEADSSYQGK
jgi:hypothetical protein